MDTGSEAGECLVLLISASDLDKSRILFLGNRDTVLQVDCLKSNENKNVLLFWYKKIKYILQLFDIKEMCKVSK